MILLNNSHSWQLVKHRHNSMTNQMISTEDALLWAASMVYRKLILNNNAADDHELGEKPTIFNVKLITSINRKPIKNHRINRCRWKREDWIKYSKKRTNEVKKNKIWRIISGGFIGHDYNERKTIIAEGYLWKMNFLFLREFLWK